MKTHSEDILRVAPFSGAEIEGLCLQKSLQDCRLLQEGRTARTLGYDAYSLLELNLRDRNGRGRLGKKITVRNE